MAERARWRPFLYRWHRRIGIAAALLVAWLAISGILIQHADALGFPHRQARADWLLDWYGIEAPPPAPGFHVDGRWLTGYGGALWLDDSPLAPLTGELVGATALADTLAAASADSLTLFTADGQLIERLGPESLPAEVRRLGADGGQLVLDTPRGAFRANPDSLQWQPGAPVAWSTAQALPDELAERLRARARGEGLSWERVLLDLHSGRLLGAWGPYFMDAAAIALLLLTASGLLNALRRRS